MADPLHFDASDLDALAHAVSTLPNLEYACYAAKVAREHASFPISDYAGLCRLLAVGALPERIARRAISPKHVKKFFAEEHFPILDERDLVGKVFGALTWGDRVHAYERAVTDPRALVPFHYRKES